MWKINYPKLIFALFGLTLHSFSSLHAQEIKASFELIESEDNYSKTIVHDILQGNNGFIWMGTVDGLYQFNGYSFNIYSHKIGDSSSLSSNTIRSIYEDQSGYIWVGTQEGGLNRFHKILQTFDHFNQQKDGFNSNNAWEIFQDSKGRLWVGTWSYGLYMIPNPDAPAKEIEFVNYQYDKEDTTSISHNIIRRVFEDSKGRIWIGTQGGGLNLYVESTDSFKRYMHDPDMPNSLNHNSVYDILEGDEGSLWLGTNGGGLDHFNIRTGEFKNYYHESSDYINSIVRCDNDLWLGTEAGIRIFDLDKKEFKNTEEQVSENQLGHKLIRCLFRDKQGIIWAGTESGVYKQSLSKQFYHYYKTADQNVGLTFNTIRAIFEAPDSSVWVGTLGKGLNRLDQKTGKWTHYFEGPESEGKLSDNQIMSLLIDSLGVLWVGTMDGYLHKYLPEQNRFIRWRLNENPVNTPNMIQGIVEGRNDDLWIGTENGLVRFNRKSNKWTTYKHDPLNPNTISGNNIQSKGLLLDSRGDLWIGTWNNGLNLLPKSEMSKTDPQFFHWKNNPNQPHSLGNNNVLSISEGQNNIMWLGTYGGGLVQFDRENSTFKSFTIDDGLPNNVIFSILQDDQGYLWLSTNNGLAKFDPQSKISINYDENDGLQANTFFWGAAHKNKYGYLYFGGVNGFNKFDPQEIKMNDDPPKIVITDLKIYNQSKRFDIALTNKDKVKLSYKDNYITIEFASLDYIDPESNNFRYKLEGFDNDWILNGNRSYVSYTNLPGGTYTFRVTGSNNDGVWNEEGAELKLIITPPWYKTWYFKVALVLLVVSMIYLIYSLRLRMWKNQKKLLEKKVTERTLEIANKNKEIQKQAEKLIEANEKIKGINENLERIVEQRSTRLKKINQELVSINQELDMFLYKTSHDFRSPIRTLLGLSAVARYELQNTADTRAVKLFNRVKETATAMDKMLEKLNKTHLILSSPGKNEEIDLLHLIHEQIERYSLSEKEIEWQYEINLPSNIIKIDCPIALSTAIDYIIENSVDFANNPSGLQICILISETRPNQLEIKISDNGEGLRNEIVPRIFDMYYRGSIRSKGNGLGLYVVKKAVEKMKGDISVGQSDSSGATFILTIPYKKSKLDKTSVSVS